MSPKHDKAMERRAARLAAVQALYQWEQSGASADTIVKEFAEHRIGNNVDGVELPNADIRLFGNLVRGAIATADELDSMIARCPHRGLERRAAGIDPPRGVARRRL